ncbi:MAG: GtrA family protein, partial [Candidatus Cloacimonetes bacterium]|nr:GtrA family protein [Candidatus Cloacimonadota bacterium]
MKSSIKKVFLQLTKFGLVGVCNTLITLGTIFLLMKIGRVHYIPANIVGYTLGFLNSFILNKIWTFRSKSVFFVEFRRFFLIFAVSYLLQLGFLIIIREKVGI